MSNIRKLLKLAPVDYFRKHLELINVFLPVSLAPREVDVLAEFLALEDAMVEDDRFNTIARKRVKTNLKMSDASLSNNLASMIKKKFLNRSDITNKITVNESILPGEKEQLYMFKLIVNGN